MTPPFETARQIRARHGFFGRQGGVSTGLYDSLNVSEAGGDDRDCVAANRAAIVEAMSFSGDALTLATQVHSNKVLEVTARTAARPEGDALVTGEPGILLGILTADCIPVLFCDPVAGVVGAAHAGWKGAVEGIVGNTIAAMQKLGARPERIMAAIGPAISGTNYEVGPDFAATITARNPATAAFIFAPEGKREHFDLPGFVLSELNGLGLASIESVGSCTYADPGRYFSHRYATHQGTTTGRQIAVIGMT
jgi:YfiH family protein